jgi:hypothetical protein
MDFGAVFAFARLNTAQQLIIRTCQTSTRTLNRAYIKASREQFLQSCHWDPILFAYSVNMSP